MKGFHQKEEEESRHLEAVGSSQKEVSRLVAGFLRWEEEAFEMTAAESCYQMMAEDSTGCCREAVEAAMTLGNSVAGCLREAAA